MPTKTKHPTAIEKLKRLGACRDAVAWCKGRTVAGAWRDCERGDWMLWLCGAMSGDSESAGRRKLVLCACECARLSLKYVPAGELRPLKSIETAEHWARGESRVTLTDVRYAAATPFAAGPYAYAADAAVAAAAAYAADAAAAVAAGAAAYAYAYAYAYDVAAAAANTRLSTLKECAEIVRKHYPKCPLKGR